MSKRNVAILVVALLVVDQISKIWVKTTMTLYESITVIPDWFFIRFIENPGAAFGMELGGDYGKLFLSLFRLVAIGFIIWYLAKLAREKAPKGVMVGFTILLAGAIGNVIDSAFYGMIFSESSQFQVATMFPEGGGYAGFLHGKVVDMLHFPIIESSYPSWFPIVGGDPFVFFSPIFNLADSYITIGLFYLVIFHWRFFK